MTAWDIVDIVLWIAFVVVGLVVAEILTEQSDVDELVERKRDQMRAESRDA